MDIKKATLAELCEELEIRKSETPPPQRMHMIDFDELFTEMQAYLEDESGSLEELGEVCLKTFYGPEIMDWVNVQ